MRWTDKLSMTSVRNDGSKVGAFWIDGKVQWWGYPVDGLPVEPYDTATEAKQAVDHSLPLGRAESPLARIGSTR